MGYLHLCEARKTFSQFSLDNQKQSKLAGHAASCCDPIEYDRQSPAHRDREETH